MALPKLESPTYTLEVPSTGEKVKFRPFLVKEQKILMIAEESKDDNQIYNAMETLISSCTFGKIDVKFPYKRFNYNINNKFNVLNTKLRLLQISNNYDLIIIDYISSSTFSEVAGSNVPILYFNLGRDEINMNAYKLIKDRVNEIKINIFDNYKGFHIMDELTSNNKKKNKFKTIYLDTLINKSFFQNLLDIDQELKIWKRLLIL